MRVESNHARGTFQQLRLALLCGLTCRLYSLYYRIEAIKSEIEVCCTAPLPIYPVSMTASQLAVDERLLSIMANANNTVVPSPAAGTHLS
jgi:hypothetical protein